MPALPGVLGLELVRHYDSARARGSAHGRMGHWRLSYDTHLVVVGSTVQILQADGSRVIFARDPKNPSHCASQDPARGFVRAERTSQGERFVWHWPTGRRLHFNERGQLEQIVAPTGEFVSLLYTPSGVLLRVTDPQGRSLELRYPEDGHAGYRGVSAIDTPVGRYDYRYGGKLPEGSRADPALTFERLVQVSASADAQGRRAQRHYLYEDGRQPTLLTGISAGFEGQALQRLVTWAYDERGRAVLSLKGPASDPASERIVLRYVEPASPAVKKAVTEVVTQRGTTTYEHAVIGGEHRLLQARGPGCANCAETDRAYGYDEQGRLVSTSRLDAKGRTIDTVRTERDALGRPTRIERVAATVPVGKQAELLARRTAAQLLARYEYSPDRTDARTGLRTPAFEPSLFAKPSVIAGREHQWRIERNEAGQVARVTETGYSPLDAHGQPGEAAIERSTSYRYARINGRSLLAEIDGPLPNGAKAEPSDSDITRTTWDGDGRHIQSIERPGALMTKLERDEAGRLIATTEPTGIATRIAYAQAMRAGRIERAGRTTSYAYDAQGRIERIDDAGRAIHLSYDAAGRLQAATDAEGYKAQASFDADGLPTVAGYYEPGQDRPLRATYRWHDEHRRLTKQLRPDGRLDTWTYDDAGRLVEYTDGDDVRHLQSRQARLDLSPDGLLRLSTPSDGRDASLPSAKRDDFGRIVMQWRPEQGLSLRTYDAADRLIKEQRLDRRAQPAGHAEYRHDAAGHLIERVDTDAQGKARTTVWRCEHGRLVEERNDAERRSFTYDEAGRIAGTRIELLDQGKTVYETTLATTYDAASSEATTRTLADASVMRIERAKLHTATGIELQGVEAARWHERLAHWVPASMAAKLHGWLPRTAIANDIALHPFNGITGYRQGNGVATARSFDIAGRLTGLKVGAPSTNSTATVETMLASQKLGYAVGPRIRSIEDSAAEPVKTRYDYRGFGALKTETEAIKTAGAGTASIELDSQGRTASDGKQRYTYTSQGQIETVSTRDGQLIATYRYNSRGQRVSKVLASGATTYYLWQDSLLVAEIEGGAIQTQYLYLGNAGRMQPVAKLEARTAAGNATGKERVLYIHNSHRGEPIAMTDDKQRVVWKAKPDEWGMSLQPICKATRPC